LGVVASRLANMCEGRPKNTISIDTVSKSVNDKNFDYANLQNGNDKRSQSEAAEMLNVTLSGAINYQLENRRYALAVNLHLAFGRSAEPCLA